MRRFFLLLVIVVAFVSVMIWRKGNKNSEQENPMTAVEAIGVRKKGARISKFLSSHQKDLLENHFIREPILPVQNSNSTMSPGAKTAQKINNMNYFNQTQRAYDQQ